MPSNLFSSTLFAGARAALAAVHGETVRFKGKADAEPRAITSIQCRLDGEYGTLGMAGDGDTETLHVGVLRNDTTGIATIEKGDKLFYDDDNRPFFWKGRRLDATDADWTLVFERKRQERQGVRE